MKKTLQELAKRAKDAIERRETFIYDIASENGQIVGNIANMRWFRLAAMREIASTDTRYHHLQPEIPLQ